MITVLFVDDEPAVLDVSRLYLEKTGDLKVDTCFSTEQALEMLKDRSYDAIVSDYEMPGIDGLGFLKILRSLGDQTPFIIFTGRGREQVVIDALNSGADFYLQKGGDPRSQFAELIHKIRLAVANRKRERALQVMQHSVEKTFVQIFWLDTAGRFIYANEASCRALGYRPDELLLLSMMDIDPLFTREEWRRFVGRLRYHKSIVLQAFHTTKDRQMVPADMSFSWGEFQDRGIIFAYAWSARGNSSFEGLIRAAETRNRSVADALAVMYYEAAEDGKLCFWNTAASAYTGFPFRDRNQAMIAFQDLVPRVQRDHVSGTLSRIAGGHSCETVQVPLTSRDGVPRPFIFQATGYRTLHNRNFVQLIELTNRPG